jgi:hypothetical protein
MENLQTYTQSTNNITKIYYNQPKIFALSLTRQSTIPISLTTRGNRGGDVHKTGYRRARRERKRKGEELTLSTTKKSDL